MFQVMESEDWGRKRPVLLFLGLRIKARPRKGSSSFGSSQNLWSPHCTNMQKRRWCRWCLKAMWGWKMVEHVRYTNVRCVVHLVCNIKTIVLRTGWEHECPNSLESTWSTWFKCRKSPRRKYMSMWPMACTKNSSTVLHPASSSVILLLCEKSLFLPCWTSSTLQLTLTAWLFV